MAITTGPGPFGLLLQHYRAAAGLSQEDLAARASLSRRGISDLERGERRLPHPGTVRRLAEALNLNHAERAQWLESIHSTRPPGSTAAHDVELRVPGATTAGWRRGLPAMLRRFFGRGQELSEL